MVGRGFVPLEMTARVNYKSVFHNPNHISSDGSATLALLP